MKRFYFLVDRADFFDWRGKCLMVQGYFMEALMDFSVAIKLGHDFYKKSEKPSAQNDNKPKPKLADYYRNAGQANYELGQYNEAL